MPLETDWSRKR